MPAVPELLTMLVIKHCADKAKALTNVDPRSTKAASFFIAFCTAVGKGIAEGTPTVMFTTTDSGFTSAPPVPGVGAGIGIKVNSEYMSMKMYTLLRDEAVKKGSKHAVWPPPDDNGGKYLRAITDGICEAIKEHYATCWILTSAHPLIYQGTGVIDPQKGSKFSGIQDSAVKSLIISYGPLMKGSMWPKMAESISKAYKDGIENMSTGQVAITGVCVPNISQVCNIPLPQAAGTGVAS